MEQIACSDRERSTLDDLTVLEVVQLADRCRSCILGCELGKRAIAFTLLLRLLRPGPTW